MGGSANEMEFCAEWYLTITNSEIRAGGWLFPAVRLADLDLEQINLADQFVPTYLDGETFFKILGGLPPGTADLGLGFS